MIKIMGILLVWSIGGGVIFIFIYLTWSIMKDMSELKVIDLDKEREESKRLFNMALIEKFKRDSKKRS